MRSWRWLFIIVALLGLALALKAGLVAFGGYVLLGVYLLSRYLARAWVTNLSAERTCPTDPLEVGDSIEVVLRLKNEGSIPIGWVLVEDMLPAAEVRPKPRVTVKGRRVQVLFLRPKQVKPVKFKLTFEGRGYYSIGPCAAETGDVFGLHRRHRLLAEPAYVMVYPKILPLPSYNFSSKRPIGEIRLANRLYEDPTRTAGVRPYVLGDPLQRVHWRATARTGELHSRIYEPTSLAGATILVDFHKAGFPKRGEPTRSDLAVTAACSLAYAVSMLNQQVGLASNGRDAVERIRDEALETAEEPPPEQGYETRFEARERFELLEQNNRLRPVVVDTRRGFDQFQLIREALARLELTDGMTFPDMVFEVAPRLPKDATLIAILPRVPVETSLALGMLRRQGFAVSAVLVGIAEDGSEDRAQAAGRLMAEGIRDVRFVNSEAELMTLGDRSAAGAPADYGFLTHLA
ncbi:DUF58 domain-containing protein [Fimbriiglobus ruber]|uniref:DUF58 domain-containing protein n=1 Tax=Fimbriiglobus ruber TaxID=1908690 RepID=A0A225DTY9_9BACT|nr:DUF58 domain-containing protein [Fimbriiglobus ruber]OWK41066.1 hypothetical protein FRUB_04958 [Fimbriiglobus ruber]